MTILVTALFIMFIISNCFFFFYEFIYFIAAQAND